MSNTETHRRLIQCPRSSIALLLAVAPDVCNRTGTDIYQVPEWAWWVQKFLDRQEISTRAATMALNRLRADEGRVGDALGVQVGLIHGAESVDVPMIATWFSLMKQLCNEDGTPVFSASSGYMFSAAFDDQ
jgi:hypothetical protein